MTVTMAGNFYHRFLAAKKLTLLSKTQDMFNDRIDAGQQLATALNSYYENQNAVVIALPRGGVVLGYTIATTLCLPLDVVLVKKLGHPNSPEYAIGAVSLKGNVVEPNTGIREDYIEQATKNVRTLLEKRYQMYYEDKSPMKLEGKTVIVVDDGVATGKTLMASLQLIREDRPKRIVVAVPVAPKEIVKQLKNYADEVICLEAYDDLVAVGLYYKKFDQVSDKEVVDLLRKAEWH